MAIKFVLKQNGLRGRIQNNSVPVEYLFDSDIFTLGSDPANNLILEQSAAEQAVVVREDDHLRLLNSAEGTRLNGEVLRREAMRPLAIGDEIRIGDYTILVIETESEPEANPEQHFVEWQTEIIAELDAEELAEETFQQPASLPVSVPVAVKEKTSNNFAAILDTLRTEEDSFYFVVKTKDQKDGHLALEQPEIPLGAGERGELVFEITQAAAVFGTIKKNWSGIVLEANRRGEILVNDEPLEAGTIRQLRNDDRLTFTAIAGAALILHEPSLLVALEPLLSARAVSNGTANLTVTNQKTDVSRLKPHVPLFERTFFGYFSFVEIFTMVIGTLIGAVLFFFAFRVYVCLNFNKPAFARS